MADSPLLSNEFLGLIFVWNPHMSYAINVFILSTCPMLILLLAQPEELKKEEEDNCFHPTTS